MKSKLKIIIVAVVIVSAIISVLAIKLYISQTGNKVKVHIASWEDDGVVYILREYGPTLVEIA